MTDGYDTYKLIITLLIIKNLKYLSEKNSLNGNIKTHCNIYF